MAKFQQQSIPAGDDLVLSISIFIPDKVPTQEKIVIKNIRGRALGWQLTPEHILKHIKLGVEKAF